MFKNKILLIFILVGVVGIMIYSFSGSEDYATTIKKLREEYEQNLSTEKDSPIATLKDFSGMKYFEPNEKFVITADFKATSGTGQSMILMTDSTTAEMQKSGEATFTIEGKTFTVSLFDEETLFLFPFRDLTSGKETYGGGRYMNISKDKLTGNKIEIDFNTAHNFYCAYNENFICPIPPKENFINVAIEAGEKVYK